MCSLRPVKETGYTPGTFALIAFAAAIISSQFVGGFTPAFSRMSLR